MFCTKCGKEITDGAKFCPFCGAQNGMSDHLARQWDGSGFRTADAQVRQEYGTGCKVWLILCCVLNAVVGAALLASGSVLMGILSIADSIAYGILLGKKKAEAFYGICIIAVLILLVNLIHGVGFLSFIGLINPVITWMVIRKYFDWGNAVSGSVVRTARAAGPVQGGAEAVSKSQDYHPALLDYVAAGLAGIWAILWLVASMKLLFRWQSAVYIAANRGAINFCMAVFGLAMCGGCINILLSFLGIHIPNLLPIQKKLPQNKRSVQLSSCCEVLSVDIVVWIIVEIIKRNYLFFGNPFNGVLGSTIIMAIICIAIAIMGLKNHGMPNV